MAQALMCENVWLQQQKFEDAERLYRQLEAGTCSSTASAGSSLTSELAQVRQDIHNALNKPPATAGAGGDSSVNQRLNALENENRQLKKAMDDLRALVLNVQSGGAQTKPAAPSKPADDDDDDDDLFGDSDDDDEQESANAAAVRQKRLDEYAAKKAKKPALVAKSSVMLDVKPWDDETDMKEVEKTVRKIEMDGLLWGAAKFVEVGYGIKKLCIMCVVEDEKVSIDDLQELICEDEDHVQSVDIAAFNKI